VLFSGFDVSSFGCGTKLKLPGPSKKAREFDFGTPYAEIVRCLEREAKGHYERVGGNEGGVLELARRGAATKEAPERWQDTDTSIISKLDVVIVFETRLFDEVVSNLQERDPESFSPIHVILMHTKDAPHIAIAQAQNALDLCRQLEAIDLAVEIPANVLKRADRGEISYILMFL
jgi:RNA polymerase II subunit A C-terminal domain phosphatase SSU72